MRPWLLRNKAWLESKYDEQFRVVFEILNEFMAAPEPKRKPIGFSASLFEGGHTPRERGSPRVGARQSIPLIAAARRRRWSGFGN